MSFEEMIALPEEEQKKLIKDISRRRGLAKTTNFACAYGAGAAKIALSSGMSLEGAKILHQAYWKRNWSVKQIAQDCITKTVNSQMWLFNPISHFWYSLRYEKDKFSTLNQGSGCYSFDSWVRKVREKGIKICGQFHDEIIIPLKEKDKNFVEEKLKEAVQEVNNELKLNVELGVSIDFGKSYSEIH